MALLFTDEFTTAYVWTDDLAATWAALAEQAGHASETFQGVGMALKGLGKEVVKKAPMGVDYEKHLTSKPVTGLVSTSKSVSGKEIASSNSESKTLHPGVITNGMSITVEGGRVLNLGNYETARVGVSITVPCDHESLGDAYSFATDWVSERIEEAIKLAKT